ncbi:MAG: ATP-binding protein [Planctomycetota bacterium]
MAKRPFADSPRVYLVGAHATGKTTLARWIRDRYGLPMISEVARRVMAELEVPIEALRANLHLVNEFQARVFEGQIEAEAAHEGPFVSDRAFCNIAYAAHHSIILPEIAADARLARYMDSVRDGVVFFLRPHKELLANDGVREIPSWDDVLRVDGMVKLLLELFSIPYIQVDCLSMQERVRLTDRVLDLAGLRPIKAAKRYLHKTAEAAVQAPKPADPVN